MRYIPKRAARPTREERRRKQRITATVYGLMVVTLIAIIGIAAGIAMSAV